MPERAGRDRADGENGCSCGRHAGALAAASAAYGRRPARPVAPAGRRVTIQVESIVDLEELFVRCDGATSRASQPSFKALHPGLEDHVCQRVVECGARARAGTGRRLLGGGTPSRHHPLGERRTSTRSRKVSRVWP